MTRATLATFLLVLGLLAGCGEDESASHRRRPRRVLQPLRRADEEPAGPREENVEEKVRSAREWADRMKDADLPDDLPAEARRGLDRMVETLAGLDADATAEELESLGDDFGKQAREEVDAMGGYVLEKCAAEIDEVMSGELDGLQDQLDGMTESP